MDKKYYVYVWLKNDTPVYVGKGCGKRAYRNKNVDVEIYQNNLTEKQAYDLEKELISRFGREDKGEGALWNLTNGGGIAWGTLYWAEGSKLKQKHREGIKNRDKEVLRRNARIATEKRKSDWQDSLYLVKTPTREILEMKSQEMKQYCFEEGLSFEQMKHIARTKPAKHKHSVHYGYDVKCVYNKVTRVRLDKELIVKGWQK